MAEKYNYFNLDKGEYILMKKQYKNIKPNMKCLVSIIVPIYNVEKYLEKCVKSIIQQSYINIEIILVDDGSTDSSAAMCDFLSEANKRIIVIHKTNGGLSDARNVGIKAAKGDYLMFVDSDDYIELNMIDELVQYALNNRLDVLEFNGIREYNTHKDLMHKGGMNKVCEVMNGQNYMLSCIKHDIFTAAAWLKFIKRELIINNGLYFKVGRIHEDEIWSPQLMLKAQRVKYLDKTYYHYVMRMGSITHNKDCDKNVIAYLNNCYELKQIYKDSNLSFRVKNGLFDYLARQYMASVSIGLYDINVYHSIMQRFFPLTNARSIETYIKSCVYFLNPKIYKKFRNRLSSESSNSINLDKFII